MNALDDKLAAPIFWGKVAGLTVQELQPDRFEQCLGLIKKYLIPEEAMCVALDMKADRASCRALLRDAKCCMRDGTSIVVFKGEDFVEDEEGADNGGEGSEAASTVHSAAAPADVAAAGAEGTATDSGPEADGVGFGGSEISSPAENGDDRALEGDAEQSEEGSGGHGEDGMRTATDECGEKTDGDDGGEECVDCEDREGHEAKGKGSRKKRDSSEGDDKGDNGGEDGDEDEGAREAAVSEGVRREERERRSSRRRRRRRRRRGRREKESKEAAEDGGGEQEGAAEDDAAAAAAGEQSDEDAVDAEDGDVVAVMVARVVQRVEHMRSYSRIKVVQGDAYQKWLALRCRLQRTANLFDEYGVDAYYRVYHIVVHPAHRKKGVGSFLVRLAAQRLAELFTGPPPSPSPPGPGPDARSPEPSLGPSEQAEVLPGRTSPSPASGPSVVSARPPSMSSACAALCTAVAPSRSTQRLLARQGFRPHAVINYHEWKDEQGQQVILNAGVGNYSAVLAVYKVPARGEGVPLDVTPLVDLADVEEADPGPPPFPGRELGLGRPPSPECPPAYQRPPFFAPFMSTSRPPSAPPPDPPLGAYSSSSGSSYGFVSGTSSGGGSAGGAS